MKLFEAKQYDYSDAGEVKPVLYDETFFKELLKECDKVEIQSTHDGEVVGYAENLYFKDGWLHGDIPVELKGKGLSPRFDVYLLDKGDYNLARDGTFTHIALADNPRNQIFYNEKGNDSMGENDDLNKVLSKRIRELEREVVTKDNQLESNKKKLEAYDELEKEVKELRKSNSEYEAKLETNQNKANKWDEYVTNKRTELIDEIAGDDSTMKETIKDWEFDKLKFLNEHKNISTDPKGVGNAGGQDLNEPPKPTEKEVKENKAKEFVEFYEKEFGKKPSFLE